MSVTCCDVSSCFVSLQMSCDSRVFALHVRVHAKEIQRGATFGHTVAHVSPSRGRPPVV